MARRKRKNGIDPQSFLALGVAAYGVTLAGRILHSPNFLAGLGLFGVLGAIGMVGYVVLRHVHRANSRRAAIEKAQAIVEQHINPLVRNRAQLVRQDAYGKMQVEKWEKEKGRFISDHIEPALSPNELKALRRDQTLIRNLIEARVEVISQTRPAFRKFSGDMTPTEFEHFCAEELREAGWNTRVTQRSRDQGVDVVAEKDGVRVAVQCKLYTGPVGNKSVQEIAAGKAHEQAKHGIVVTNSRYTQAAEQLAQANGILLLHYCELKNLSDLIGL